WASSGHGGNIQNLVTAPNGGQEPADLVFATSVANCGTSNLNFETESYVSSTGALVDWVNVPSLSAGTVIYACYDDASVTTDQSHPSSTWNSNFIGVWHLPEAVSTSVNNFRDSTANGLSATATGTAIAASTSVLVQAPGEIGGSLDFTTTTIDLYTATNTIAFNNMTLEAWINPTTLGQFSQGTMINLGSAGGSIVFRLGATNPNSLELQESTGVWVTNSNTITTSTWQYVAATFNNATTSTVPTFYINGQGAATVTISNPSVSSTVALRWNIGNQGGTGIRTFIGYLDEMRVSHEIQSSSWIATSYNNQANPDTFYGIGSETANSLPSTPGIPTYTNIATSTLTVNWTAATGTTWYSIVRSPTANGTYSQIATTTSLTYGDTGLANSTTYFYEVAGVNSFGTSTYSASSSVTTLSGAGGGGYAASGTLQSVVFDTGVPSGAQLNSFIWRGTQPTGTSVEFQFAVSNSANGPWTYLGPAGAGSYYTAAVDTPTQLDYSLFNNFRYFRYAITLYPDSSQSNTPTVNNIIVNWSP
ncbi:MAG TPA: LamG-like jellyroll fold domain-containing protein, partial [Candidatus Paceibacterota bacterium]|nr:LamG-like jellyroll fold domain-containing protein [Candidatus Paceibacterota bacterium]